MGFAKNRAMGEEEQGWHFSSQYVCPDCVDEPALVAVLTAAARPEVTCDFCGSTPAAPLDVLLEALVTGFQTEYERDPGLPWELPEEYSYFQLACMSTQLLVLSHSDMFANSRLLEAVEDGICEADWLEQGFLYPTRFVTLSIGWNRFCQAVKHETRYVFWFRHHEGEPGDDPDLRLPISSILLELAGVIARLGLVRRLPAGTRFYRARTHSTELDGPKAAADLGTAKLDQVKRGNRMSPAGIPMFYGSEQDDVAIDEVSQGVSDGWVTVGAFETSELIFVLDLTDLPDTPSMFEPGHNVNSRKEIEFLYHFVNELSRPIKTEDEEIDYVPTQVVSEYVMRMLQESLPSQFRQQVVGILYPSAVRDRSAPRSLLGGVSVVLDIPRSRCIDRGQELPRGRGPCLILEQESLRTAQLPGSSAQE